MQTLKYIFTLFRVSSTPTAISTAPFYSNPRRRFFCFSWGTQQWYLKKSDHPALISAISRTTPYNTTVIWDAFADHSASISRGLFFGTPDIPRQLFKWKRNSPTSSLLTYRLKGKYSFPCCHEWTIKHGHLAGGSILRPIMGLLAT